jgi:hypothetical protein
VNVLRLSTLIILPLLISGCASFSLFGNRVKPIEVQTKAVERTRLNLPEQAPLQARELNWVIITPENIEQVFADMSERNESLVLFAMTDKGYEQLSLTMAEIRNYIAQQRAILIKYKEYYEPENSAEKK